MIIINLGNREKCSGCSACAEICPVKCIEMKQDKMGFLYPFVHPEKCINCGLCERVCPELNNNYHNKYDVSVYAALSKDNSLRLKSSSGGIFSLLANCILKDNGVVFGAVFEEGFNSVCHVAITSSEELLKLQGSKYLQSNLKNTYSEVKKFLELGKKVLFSGTPCQIAGLHSFLMKNYDNLYLLDFICHGVPAPNVWKEYKSYLEKKNKGAVRTMSFRDKSEGWNNYSINMTFDNGKRYQKKYKDDLYLKGFLRDYYLRPSCYNCNHKGFNRLADITLGDLWGVDKFLPSFSDNKGVSAVIISSSKGEKLFSEIFEHITYVPIDAGNILDYNLAITKSAKWHNGVQVFEEEFQTCPINALLKKYCMLPVYKRVLYSIKFMIKKYILRK